MNTRRLSICLAGALLSAVGLTAQANVIWLDPVAVTTGVNDPFSVDIHVFFEEPTVGGSFDLFYDPDAVRFISFAFDDDFLNNVSDPAFAHLPDNCYTDGAPFGGCAVGDAELNAIGFGSFDGIAGSYLIGTLVFEGIAPSISALTMADNDAPFEGFYSAVTGLPMPVLYNSAKVVVTPLPPAIWLFAAGLGLLASRRRRSVTPE